jgi:tetratricopeptide (TPR) repeat protein
MMSATTSSELIKAFDPRVTAFQTPTFILAEDLAWLDQLRGLRAEVAVILHSTRILEVLAGQALVEAGLADTRDHNGEPLRMFSVLKQLMDYDQLAKDTYRLLDRLRDLGNKARHVLRKVTFADAEQAYAIALRALHWYFCEFPKGKMLKCLSFFNQPLDALLPTDVANLLAMLESAELDNSGFLAILHLDQRHCPILLSPVIASVFIEKLVDRKRTDEAQVVLTAALARFPDDVRLRQLQGLIWSRTGRLKEACDWLEAIEPTDSAADEETQGILAGVYKRRAEAEPDRNEEWLKKCHDRYARGWEQSLGTNTYLGINAAATALWLGLPGQQAAHITTSIRTMLEERRRRLTHSEGPTARFLNCWDQLTLAEAYLLLGEWNAARQYYREAVERFPKQSKALEVARHQADKNLVALGRTDLLGSIFPE